MCCNALTLWSRWGKTTRLTTLLALLLVGTFTLPVSVHGGDCYRFVVTAADGYTNVRAGPRVEADNLVAALPTGTVVDADDDVGGRATGPSAWVHVASPVHGWIHGSQLTKIPCDRSAGPSSEAGLRAIQRLAAQARAGEPTATASFLAMSRGVDGSLADVYLDEIRDWAINQPASLAKSLGGRPKATRDAALEMIGLALEGASLDQRGRFRMEMLRAGQ